MGLQPLLPKHRKNKEKRLILLADPDKINAPDFLLRFSAPLQAAIDVVLVGGSLIQRNTIESLIREFKAACATPVYLFPGSPLQLAPNADGILFLSLISGRNPEYLIGRHIEAAPLLKAYNFDVIPTGYILIEGGQTSSTAYITQTQPIPSGKPDLAVATALAGQFLGMRLIYLEAGSGAQTPAPAALVQQVAQAVDLPIWVGGGIKSVEAIDELFCAGAEGVVLGSVFEREDSASFWERLVAYRRNSAFFV